MAHGAMHTICDDRTGNHAWSALPLLVEEEDRGVFPDEICRQGRSLLPQTYTCFRHIPALQALAVSTLKPGGHIKPHCHQQPSVTAALCLQAEGDTWIKVNGDQKRFIPGQTLIFDYQSIHEVRNDGPVDRVVLLILLPNKLKPT